MEVAVEEVAEAGKLQSLTPTPKGEEVSMAVGNPCVFAWAAMRKGGGRRAEPGEKAKTWSFRKTGPALGGEVGSRVLLAGKNL